MRYPTGHAMHLQAILKTRVFVLLPVLRPEKSCSERFTCSSMAIHYTSRHWNFDCSLYKKIHLEICCLITQRSMTFMSGFFRCAKGKGLWTEEFVSGLSTAMMKVNVIFDDITTMNLQIGFRCMTTCNMTHIEHFRRNFFHLLQGGKHVEGGNFVRKRSRLHIYHK